MSEGKKRIRERFNYVCRRRDKFKCKICDIHESAVPGLEVHHITNRNLMPNGGYVLENGITVCPEHHVVLEAGMMSEQAQYQLIGSSYEKALDASNRLC